jgi:BirA family biotin operon repressor/biotin-[acetyl-CoA-carboxylase] ligase
LLSVLVRPRPAFAHELLIMASLACAAAARSACRREIRIKWPNDVRCDGLKLAGVLAESRQGADGLAVVVGIGLNVNMDPARAEGAPGATSLRSITGRPHARAEVLRSLLDEMDPMYRSLVAGETLVPEWRESLETIGQHVTVSSADPRAPGVIVEGIARDVDEMGRLLVEGDDGMMRAVAAGEVTLRSGDGTI